MKYLTRLFPFQGACTGENWELLLESGRSAAPSAKDKRQAHLIARHWLFVAGTLGENTVDPMSLLKE